MAGALAALKELLGGRKRDAEGGSPVLWELIKQEKEGEEGVANHQPEDREMEKGKNFHSFRAGVFFSIFSKFYESQ